MHKTSLLFALILFISLTSFSQHRDSIITGDYNMDGFADSLYCYYEFNRCVSLTYYDGKDKEKFEIHKSWEKSEFIGIICFPEELMGKEYQLLRDTISSHLTGSHNPVSKIDPSLNWLLTAYENQDEKPQSENFSRYILVDPVWYNDLPPFPTVENHRFASDSFPGLLSEYGYLHGDAGECILLYYGHNHKKYNFKTKQIDTSFIPSDSNQVIKTYSTAHGVLAEKEGKYAWFFISTGRLTGGPWKLRWYSIKKVLVFEGHIIIHHISRPFAHNQVFIINTTTGKAGQIRLDEDFAINPPYCFEVIIEGNQLILTSNIAKDDSDCINRGTSSSIRFDLLLLIKDLAE